MIITDEVRRKQFALFLLGNRLDDITGICRLLKYQVRYVRHGVWVYCSLDSNSSSFHRTKLQQMKIL
jgi:hypothetical protein